MYSQALYHWTYLQSLFCYYLLFLCLFLRQVSLCSQVEHNVWKGRIMGACYQGSIWYSERLCFSILLVKTLSKAHGPFLPKVSGSFSSLPSEDDSLWGITFPVGLSVVAFLCLKGECRLKTPDLVDWCSGCYCVRIVNSLVLSSNWAVPPSCFVCLPSVYIIWYIILCTYLDFETGFLCAAEPWLSCTQFVDRASL